MEEAKLYVIPGSHPSRAARLMLEHKGIPFKRVDLIPGVSKGVAAGEGFPGETVPALKLEGRKVQGSREIGRALDRIQPEPPLFPADPEKRGEVEEAERWGDDVPADAAPDHLVGAQAEPRADDELLGGREARGPGRRSPPRRAGRSSRGRASSNEATDENVRADLAALPADLDRIDADRRRRHRRRASRTRPTSRSPPASGC